MNKMYICLLILSLQAFPQCLNANVVKEAHVEVELISEEKSVQPGRFFWLALRLKMDEGWHIYWKNPGDSGLPVSIEWHLPAELKAGEIQWPYPFRIEAQPLVSYGYEGEVSLISKIHVSNIKTTSSPLTIKAVVRWLACRVECVPGKARLEVDLPFNEQRPDINIDWAPSFSQARSQIPINTDYWGVEAFLSDGKLVLDISSDSFYPLTGLSFFPEDSRLIDHASARVIEETSNGYRLSMRISDLYTSNRIRARGVLFSNEGWRGPNSEKAMMVDSEIGMNVKPDELGIWVVFGIMLMAFMGGLILNLMPCVLPVLSLKIMHFVVLAGDQPRKAFGHALFFAAGVISCFWILGLVLLLLRTLGEPIGWGYQLQSPAFLVVLIFLFFILALNCFGVFNIGPGFIGSMDGQNPRHTRVTSYLSGVIATIVATPCTAPFMGGALGFGLTQPWPIAMGVFTFLGIGMAFPFTLLSCMPGLVRFIPKPGPWMFMLKELMGFFFMATVMWLFWVLSQVSGVNIGFSVFTCLWFAGLGLWLYGSVNRGLGWGKSAKFLGILGLLISVASFMILVFSVFQLDRKDRPQQDNVYKIVWERFSKERLDQVLLEGKPVFIDFTAAWCLTCRVNERVTFGSPKVLRRLKELNMVMLRADWTNRNPEISDALAGYGRSSIPLYVLYDGSSREKPVILPEILTPDIFLGALEDRDESSMIIEKDI